MAATQDADMAEDDSSELAPSTSIPTATSATTVGATPTTSLGNDEGEEEEPKPKPRKKRSASSAKKKKEAESNGASGESADGGEATVHICENFMHRKTRRVYGGIAVILLFLLFLLVY